MYKTSNCERCSKPFNKHVFASEVIYCSNQCYIEAKCRINEMTGCWEWVGTLDKNSYGQCSRDNERIASRLAYKTYKGSIPKGYSVCHKCDVTFCVNPNHLFLGTQKDNMQDMYSKRRNAKGESHGRSKLTEEQVLAIIHDTRKQTIIAAEYGIARGQICSIKSGKKWKHVFERFTQNNSPGSIN